MKTMNIAGVNFTLTDSTAERVGWWLKRTPYGCTRAAYWGEIPSAEDDAFARAAVTVDEAVALGWLDPGLS